MTTTPNAILINLDGHTVRITLPDDPDQRATVIKAVTNSHDLEAVDLTTNWAMWLDETGGMLGQHRRSLNPVATLLANRYGVHGGIRGPVVITGTSPAGTVPLTAEDLANLESVIGEAADIPG
ncbi:hypothetical protein JBE04_08270 [Streptomyces sp. PRKS01-29]|nr:hypothetical protein [Streptomyces sabulosicollis]MBI0294476.1 hypothetical protein [Streptomyces sabulosicollis]